MAAVKSPARHRSQDLLLFILTSACESDRTDLRGNIMVSGTRPASRRTFLKFVFVAPMFIGTAVPLRAEEYVRESAYNYIIVVVDQSVVWLRRVENGQELSAIDINQPGRQVIPYTRYLFLPALLNSRPHSALNIGLGAGAFNRLFNLAFPECELTTVEIDPMIVDIAREFTGFTEAKNNHVEIADGRRFLNQSREHWDWIVLDAYIRKSQIPPHLTTVEFFGLVRNHLTPNGLFVVNLTGSKEFLRRVSATIEIAFPGSIFWSVGGNVVCVASLQPALNQRVEAAVLPKLDVDLVKYDVDLADLVKGPHWSVAPDANAALTDDFAPTEYLNR
jgi:spermidine synthase